MIVKVFTERLGVTLASVSSYIFHPAFFIVYNLFFILCFRPHWFGVNSWHDKKMLLLLVTIYTIFIPFIAILMLRVLNAIKSIQMYDRHDRIFPLIIVLVFYLWLWINLKHDPSVPKYWIWYLLAAVISCVITLIVNNWIKSSLHTTAVIATLSFWLWIRFLQSPGDSLMLKFDREGTVVYKLDYFLMWMIFVGGWIITGRLLIQAHRYNEIIIGIIIAIIAIIASNRIVF